MVNGLNRYKVIVSAGLPTSVKMVALRISMATGWEFRPNPFEKRDWDYMVYVSDPKIDSWFVGRNFPPNRVIMYLVSGVLIGPSLTKYIITRLGGKLRPTNQLSILGSDTYTI